MPSPNSSFYIHSGLVDQRSPPPSKPLSSPSSSFTALSKIRKSIKRGSGSNTPTGGVAGCPAAAASPKRFGALGSSLGASQEDRETMQLRDDLAASKEEGAATREVIAVLRKQIEEMEKEKETM